MTDEIVDASSAGGDASTTPPELAAALVLAWAELGNVTKASTANAGTYSYSYADLGAVLDLVRPILGKYELAMLQPVERRGDTVTITTVLLHSSGQSMSWVYEVHAAGNPQQVGSAITYGRRYSAMAALGIAAGGDDDDGAAAAGAPRPPDVGDLTAQVVGLFDRFGLKDPAARTAEISRILGRDVTWAATNLDEKRRVILVLEARKAQDEDAEQLNLGEIDDDHQ